MKHFIIVLILINLNTIYSFSQVDSCNVIQKELLVTITKDSISVEDVEKSFDKCSWLIKKRCSEFQTDNPPGWITTTSIFGDICLKTDGKTAVKYYRKYLSLTSGSAEELRAVKYEELFKKFPYQILDDCNNNIAMLDLLVWGILDNCYTKFDNATVEEIVYQTYPILNNSDSAFQAEKKYIIKSIKQMIE